MAFVIASEHSVPRNSVGSRVMPCPAVLWTERDGTLIFHLYSLTKIQGTQSSARGWGAKFCHTSARGVTGGNDLQAQPQSICFSVVNQEKHPIKQIAASATVAQGHVNSSFSPHTTIYKLLEANDELGRVE